MPSARYLLVEGVDGHPVADPRAQARHGEPARYVGWTLDGCSVAEGGGCKAHPDTDGVLEHYKPEPQVHLDHPDLQRAIKAVALRLIAETVAKNHDAARVALTVAPPAAPIEKGY